MPIPHDPLHILLAHDRWATHRILDAAATLTPEQLSQRFEIGIGSLHDTIIHMIGAHRVWADVLAQRAPRPWIDEAPRRTVDQLRQLWDQATTDTAAQAHTLPLDHTITRERQGVVTIYSRADILTHVTTHGMHHRAQCLNILRHLGITPMPQSSVVEWSRAGRPTTPA